MDRNELSTHYHADIPTIEKMSFKEIFSSNEPDFESRKRRLLQDEKEKVSKCFEEMRNAGEQINLAHVNLTRLNLSNMDLRHVNFSHAILIRTNLNKAILDYANFQGALIYKTSMFDTSYSKTNILSGKSRSIQVRPSELGEAKDNLDNGYCNYYGVIIYKGRGDVATVCT